MKRQRLILRINVGHRDKQIPRSFNSFDLAVPIAGVFTIGDNEFVHVKMLIRTMPIHIGVFIKVSSEGVRILLQDIPPKFM